MKRWAGLALAISAFAVLTAAQWCAPCGQPAPEPPCFTAFWQGEDVCFELVVPWSVFCCCCCGAPQVQVLGWRVITPEGKVVYQETFPTPVPPGKWVWKQVDSTGKAVAPGYYKIIISTVSGEFENTVRIVARDGCCQPCCFFPFFFGCWLWSRPCAISWCTPYVKLYRCPTCVAPCVPPCCGVTIFWGVDP